MKRYHIQEVFNCFSCPHLFMVLRVTGMGRAGVVVCVCVCVCVCVGGALGRGGRRNGADTAENRFRIQKVAFSQPKERVFAAERARPRSRKGASSQPKGRAFAAEKARPRSQKGAPLSPLPPTPRPPVAWRTGGVGVSGGGEAAF